MRMLRRKVRPFGFVLMLLFALAPLGRASAQEVVPAWTPAPGTIGISAGGYGTDSEIMRRAGLWWVRSTQNVLGVTGAFWEGYRHLEFESRWFSAERGKVSPYVMVSGTLQRNGDREGLGPGVGIGAEFYPAVPVGFTAALGWRSLYQRWRVSGYSESPTDIHWFTIRFEMTLYIQR